MSKLSTLARSCILQNQTNLSLFQLRSSCFTYALCSTSYLQSSPFHNTCHVMTSIVRANSTSPKALLKYHDDLFRYTRGRFVMDEEHEMAQRHVTFDVYELARIAAAAVGADRCISIKKHPDGMYNKAFLLIMDDGTEVVAKIPNPNAGYPHLTTASEVATMEFVRTELGTPLPRVFAWNSKLEDNPVGAEYIIMEKAKGVEIEQVWRKLQIQDRLKVVKTIASYQEAWSSVSFNQYGSIYFFADLDEELGAQAMRTCRNGVEKEHTKFAIGPSTGREYFDDMRNQAEFNKGPCEDAVDSHCKRRDELTVSLGKSLTSYHRAIGEREAACVRQLPRLPKSPVGLYGPGIYQPTRDKKLEAIEIYFGLLDHLLPVDESISKPHVWHNDLHAANIFVDPSNPTEITGIIDWQSTQVCPLYFQARQPFLIDHQGPVLHGLERPVLPENHATMDPVAQAQATALYFQQSLCALYRTLVQKQSPTIFKCFEFQETPAFDMLLLARNLMVDGEATYTAQAVELEHIWSSLPSTGSAPFPLAFSKEDVKQAEADAEGASRGIELRRTLRDSMGDLFPERGIVKHDQYDEAKEALRQLKEQVIDRYASNEEEIMAWEAAWPFDP